MKNEWRDNIWLVLALTIVSLAVWLFSSKLEYAVRGLFVRSGFDAENVYSIKVRTLSSGAPEYEDMGENSLQKENRDLLDIISRIRKNPNVEAVSIGWGCTPYMSQYLASTLRLDGAEKDTIGYSSQIRYASPEIIKVLGITSRTGKSSDDLMAILGRGEILVANIPNPNADYEGHLPEDLPGKVLLDREEKYRVGDIVDNVRKSEYELPPYGMTLIPVVENEDMNMWGMIFNELNVRVKPGCGANFEKDFENDLSLRRQRNVYLTDISRLTKMGEIYNMESSTQTRLMTMVIIAMLVIVALGISGVFWFRIQRRIGEIAIRKVCGATRMDIFRRILGEGFILLIIATILAALIGWIFIRVSIWNETNTFLLSRYVITEIATAVFVGVAITFSVVYPAWSAMSIEPAIAIKEE